MNTFNKEAFKKAFALVYQFIKEHMTGHDADQLVNLRDHIGRGVEEYPSADLFIKDLYRRTDISDDDKWELECHEAAIEHIFAVYSLHKEIHDLQSKAKAEVESAFD